MRTDIGSGHDAGDEGIGMCVPRLQINVQHVKRKTAFFTGNVQCELDDDPGILSARKRNKYSISICFNNYGKCLFGCNWINT